MTMTSAVKVSLLSTRGLEREYDVAAYDWIDRTRIKLLLKNGESIEIGCGGFAVIIHRGKL